jgi:hypothetical protein
MTPLALLIIAAGGTVAALSVSSSQRRAAAAAAERLIDRAPAQPPPPPAAPKPKLLPASTASTTIPAHVVEVAPGLMIDASLRAPRVAAQDLYTYVTGLIRAGKSDQLGNASAPNSTIAAAQNDMRLVKVNGVYDAPTRARGKELLGREFPARDSKRVAAVPVTATPAVVLESPAIAPPPLSASVAARTPREAAEALLIYVQQPGADLGSKASPSSIVHDAQQAMGGITADGVYGPQTSKRIAALTGKAAPQRGLQPAAADAQPSAAVDAAETLLEYVSSPGANFGSKSRPSAQVRAGQKAMGGLTVDGIYGAKTQARIEALTGKQAPTRS